MAGSGRLRREMVRSLAERGEIRSDAVRRAFLAVPREDFVPVVAAADGLEAVYNREAALVTKKDARGVAVSSSSAPGIMAPMLEALAIEPGMRVLEVGTGTGYNAALLSLLAEPGGRVVSVEIDPNLARRAKRALRSGGYGARVVIGDAIDGSAVRGAFERVIVTASTPGVPKALFDPLRDGGVMVVPLRFGEEMFPQVVVAFRREGPELRSIESIGGGFMGLRSSAEDQGVASDGAVQAVARVDGVTSVIAWMQGERVGRLTKAQRKSLLALLLEPPRRQGLPARESPSGLRLYLALAGDWGAAQYGGSGAWGTAIVDRSGGGAAAVIGERGQRGRLLAWGDEEAEERVLQYIERWRWFGRPDTRDLRCTVRYDRPVPRCHWRSLRVGGCYLALDWATRPP